MKPAVHIWNGSFFINETFAIVEVHSRDCREALDFPVDDYEGALLIICGRKARVDCLVSRDKHLLGLEKTDLDIQAPEALLRALARKTP